MARKNCEVFLVEFAKEGTALEFAIGTGRIALPLTAKGVQVDGIELSPHMVEKLHAKSEGTNINVIVGDMCSATTNRLLLACISGLQHDILPLDC